MERLISIGRLFVLPFLIVFFPVLLASCLQAQEGDSLLKTRLDQLEKQNDLLRKYLDANTSESKSLIVNSPDKPSLASILSMPANGTESISDQQSKPVDSNNSFLLKWMYKDGFKAESEKKDFTFALVTSLQFDNGWYSVGDNIQATMDSPLTDGSDLRRLRLRAEGTAYKQFDYCFDVDLSGATDFRTVSADPATPLLIADAWIAMNDIPFIGTIKAGHQKEFITFSNATSDRYLSFMERPLVFDAFEDGFQFSNGFTVANNYFDKHLNLWLGFFRTGTRTGAFGVGPGRYAFDQRLCYFPLLDQDNQRWVLVSASGSIRTLPDTNQILPGGSTVPMPNTRFFNRPTVRAGGGFQIPRIISTPVLYSDNGEGVLGLNAQTSFGPLTIGGEYLSVFLGESYLNTLPGYVTPVANNGRPAQSIGSQTFDGFYLQATCFLTSGDHHDVNTVTPGLARVKPVRQFAFRRNEDGEITKGPGAWEVKFRYDTIALNNPLFTQSFIQTRESGGAYQVLTTGLNWYWNSNMRVMADYTYNLRSTGNPPGKISGDGSFSAFGMRVQADF